MSESEGIRQYRKLEHKLLERRKDKVFLDSDEEDDLLCELDRLWWSLSEEECAKLNEEGAE